MTTHERPARALGRCPVVAWLLGCVVVLLGGCASSAEVAEAPVEVPEAFSQSGVTSAPERWWTVFGDPHLDALVDTALASNFDLMAAWQRLQAARAVVDREAAAQWSFVDAEASAAAGGTEDGYDGLEEVRLGLGASYEVDLWGRIEASVDAERFQARATRADYQAAALSLSGEVARMVYRLVEARSQLALVRVQLRTNREVLQLIENRFGAGQVRSVDVLRQRQLVEATREQQAEAAAQVQLAEQQLAVLLGRAPTREAAPVPEVLPELPPLPETGVPVELVERRPDVRSAFYDVRAADRSLAAAISSQYPRLTLTATASSSAPAADDLFRRWAYSFGGSLLAPLFYGGELRAEVDRTEAVRQQRLFAYGQTVLVALREVEAALTTEAAQRRQLQHLERQVELGEQAYQQLRVQYFNGSGTYLEVLTALDDLQQLRRDLLATRLALVENRIELYRALAGSFETERETS